MLTLFFQYFIYLAISIVLSCLLYVLPYLVNYQSIVNSEKLSSYECGFEPFNDSKGSFNVHFYIVGILFIIFDLEIVFLIPWSKNLYLMGLVGFWSVIFFLLLLTLGF
jgi:NADH-quinone oxidoreductase subunit A